MNKKKTKKTKSDSLIKNAPNPTIKRKYKKLAEKAEIESFYAIKLKCIDCCGWDEKEAAKCKIDSCPLYYINQKILFEKKD
jgi:hypothetical protein